MRLFFRCTVGRLVLGSFQLIVEYVSIATYLVPCMYLCTYRLVHEFLLNIKTCIKAQKCICIEVCMTLTYKVQLFWEGHKNLDYHPYGFDIYLVNVKTIRRMAKIFVAFSQKLNFIHTAPVQGNMLEKKFYFILKTLEFCILKWNLHFSST